MELRPITMDDLPLYRRLLTDPAVMTELGGPLPEDGLEEKLREIVGDVASGEVWYDVIVADGTGAGTICIWEHLREGTPIEEIGWMVAPEHQGRGLATRALAATLERARADGRWSEIHAHPGVTNAASNALCRRAGFTLVGEREVRYKDRLLLSNEWRLELR